MILKHFLLSYVNDSYGGNAKELVQLLQKHHRMSFQSLMTELHKQYSSKEACNEDHLKYALIVLCKHDIVHAQQQHPLKPVHYSLNDDKYLVFKPFEVVLISIIDDLTNCSWLTKFLESVALEGVQFLSNDLSTEMKCALEYKFLTKKPFQSFVGVGKRAALARKVNDDDDDFVPSVTKRTKLIASNLKASEAEKSALSHLFEHNYRVGMNHQKVVKLIFEIILYDKLSELVFDADEDSLVSSPDMRTVGKYLFHHHRVFETSNIGHKTDGEQLLCHEDMIPSSYPHMTVNHLAQMMAAVGDKSLTTSSLAKCLKFVHAETPVLEKLNDSEGGCYRVDAVASARWLFDREALAYVGEKYGAQARRLYRIMQTHGHLDLTQIEKLSVMAHKDVKHIVYSLYDDGLLTIKEVCLSTSAWFAAKTTFLWGIDRVPVASRLLEHCGKAATNLCVCRRSLENQNKRLVEKATKVEALKNNPQLNEEEKQQIDTVLTDQEKCVLDRYRKQRQLLTISVQRLLSSFVVVFVLLELSTRPQ